MNRTFETSCGALEQDFNRYYRLVSGYGLSFGNQRADFALSCVQSPAKDRSHSRQIVSSQGKSRLRLHLGQSNKTGFAQTTYSLRPTEYLFNQLAQAQTVPVTCVPDCSPINGATRFLGNVRGDASLVHRLDKTPRVVILVRTQGGPPLWRAFCNYRGGFALSLADRRHRFHIDSQAIPILAHIAEARLVSRSFLERLCGIGRRDMRVVLRSSPVKSMVTLRPPPSDGLPELSFALKLFASTQVSACRQQRGVRKKPDRATAEYGDLDQSGSQQALRQNRRTTCLGVQRLELTMQCCQNAVHRHAQFTQWVRHWNPLLQCPVIGHLWLGHVGAAYEVFNALNFKDRLYDWHGLGGVFQQPVNNEPKKLRRRPHLLW